MGVYLAVGLTIAARLSAAALARAKISEQEIIEEIDQRGYFSTNLYNVRTIEDTIEFQLKENLFQQHLLPLLERLYPALYEPDPDSRYPQVLATLNATPATEWLTLAEEKRFAEFQKLNSGRYIRHHLNNQRWYEPILIDCDVLILSLEGKILMEEYGRQFMFFQRCISHTFSDFPLVNAVGVFITR